MSQVTYFVDGQAINFGGYFSIDEHGNLIILSDASHSGHMIGSVAAGKWDWIQVNGLETP